LFFFASSVLDKRFGVESDEKETEEEAKAKGLIAQRDKVGCTEEKMREGD